MIMKKLVVLAILIAAFSVSAIAQKFITKNGYIRFYSDAAMEKIEATNHQVNAALDLSTGDFVFKVLMKSFEFEKALMQEHFNENYIESDKYPNSIFQGKILNIKDVNQEKDGEYPVNVEGKLTIHGVTKPIKEKGVIVVGKGKVTGKSKFNVLLADYKIEIPKAVLKNIAESVEVTVEVAMDKANK